MGIIVQEWGIDGTTNEEGDGNIVEEKRREKG